MKIFIAIAFLCFIKVSLGFFGYTSKFNSHEEPFIPHTNRFLIFGSVEKSAVQEKWIEQRLDNFNPQDNRLWRMRYLENDVHFKPGGPIFVFVGGEWSISPGAIGFGSHIYDLAEELSGIIYYTEHRYYGQSRPTENTSTENLRFLSVDQALADLAFFISHVKASSPEFAESGVILVGGSYGASMVTWMRKKYPHLVTGAWASSAPVNAQVDFSEYKEVMTTAIKRVGGEECASIMENAFIEMERLVEEKDVRRLLISFNLCWSLDLSKDVAHFFYEMSDLVASLIQSHRPGRIEFACDYMQMRKEQEGLDDMEAFGAWVKHGQYICADMSYQANIRKFRNVDWGAEANRQMRQWVYQTCTQFAWFQTSTSPNQIFGSSYPLDYFVKLCKDLYDIPLNLTIIEENIKRTNVIHGGFQPSLTNVYFTNGDLDPWHPNSILEELNDSTPVALLPLSAHVSDLGQIAESDSPEMRASKEKVRELIHQWLGVLKPEPEPEPVPEITIKIESNQIVRVESKVESS